MTGPPERDAMDGSFPEDFPFVEDAVCGRCGGTGELSRSKEWYGDRVHFCPDCTTPAPSADLPDDPVTENDLCTCSHTRAYHSPVRAGRCTVGWGARSSSRFTYCLCKAFTRVIPTPSADLPDDLAEARRALFTFLEAAIALARLGGEVDLQAARDSVDALIALAQADDEAPASVHWRALAAEENARARLAEGEVTELRAALARIRDTVERAADDKIGNPLALANIVHIAVRALATPKPVEPEQ